MQIFEERIEDLPEIIARDLKPCLKKPIPVQATQMYGEFRVKTMEGDYKLGKPGDYLMVGVMGEVYICDKEVFEKSYDWV